MGKKHKNAGKHKKKAAPQSLVVPDAAPEALAPEAPAPVKKKGPKNKAPKKSGVKKPQPAEDLAEEPAERVHYTARHLLAALQALDPAFLDMPLVLIHGRALQKPNLVQGVLPMPVPVDRATVESKKPSLLAVGELVDL